MYENVWDVWRQNDETINSTKLKVREMLLVRNLFMNEADNFNQMGATHAKESTEKRASKSIFPFLLDARVQNGMHLYGVVIHTESM